MPLGVGLALVLLLILLHGFFVAGEFGIVAIDRSKIEKLAEEGNRKAKGVQLALKTLSFQLSGAQLGITITSLLVGFLIEPVLAPLFEPLLEGIGVPAGSALGISIAVALVIATSFEMVVAELIPKNLAIARPMGVSIAIATPLRWVNTLMKPLIVLLNSSANASVRLVGIEPRDELTAIMSLEEIEILVRSAREGGALREEEASLLARSITFGDKTAADALVPRVDIVHVDPDQTLMDLARVALESGHSRLPVCGDDIDDILGVAHVKDTYPIPIEDRGETSIAQIMRPPLVFPETKDLASLLIEMRRQRTHLVVIVDEYGGTAGILTLEDLLEEIVGDIEDEYDPADADTRLTSPPPGVFRLSGRLHPDEIQELTGFEMPEGDYETLAGFLLTLFDRIPKQGEHVSFDHWELKVVEMDKNRIAQVLLVAPGSRPEEEPAEDER